MADAVNALTLQFLEWVASDRRTHADVMETWRSSCPRLPIWEDAVLAGLVRYDGASRAVELTRSGKALLARNAASGIPAKQAAD
ncbi:MAG: hypothetical protein EXQ95_14800 [Alphaproteobacteria bacterium]|nr:hypothetical protein [Alphaproteobacteria bacterium]